MQKRIVSAIIYAVVTGCASGPWQDFRGDEHSATIPYDVRKFVNNAQACRHYVDEDPYDPGRAAFLEARVKEKCTDLEKRYEYLRKHYAANAEALEMITQTWQKFNE